MGDVSKNDVVLAYEQESGYTRVLAGNVAGYLSSGKLKAVNASANVGQIVQAKAPVSLYADAGRGAKVGSLGKDSIACTLMETGNYAVVRQGGTIGVAAKKDLTFFNEKTTSLGWLLYTKKTDIKAGEGKSDKKLGSIAQGELVEVLYSGKDTAVVRKGKVIGAASLSGATLYDAKTAATGTVQAKSDAAFYSGPGSKYARQGTLSKGDQAEKLGVYSSYTVVRANGKIGLVSTKSVTAVEEDARQADNSQQPAADGKLAPRANPTYHADTLAFIDAMNQYRIDEGVPSLKIDDVLMQAAEIRAKELAQSFSHTRPDGSQPNTVDSSITGENIGRLNYYMDYARAAAEFMKSKKGHREIALHTRYTKTGAAHYYANGYVYWVHLFG